MKFKCNNCGAEIGISFPMVGETCKACGEGQYFCPSKPLLLPDLSDKDYHAQVGEDEPLLTYSTAKTIATKSAYHAWLNHPKFGNEPRVPTAAMANGSIVHSLLLGGGDEIVVIQADSYRTAVAKLARDEAYSEGKTPILEKDMLNLQTAVTTIKERINDITPYFFEPHQSELAVRYELEGVKCQSKWDWIQPGTGRMIDLKTTNSASPDSIQRDIVNFGYDIQEYMYTRAADLAFPDMAGRFTWEFLFVEIEPPYMVSVIETDGVMKQLGEMRTQRAMRTWKESRESGTWPGYGRTRLSAPAWAMIKEEGE